MHRNFRRIFFLAIVLIVAGCGSVASRDLYISEDVLATKYTSIRSIVIEEAARNGYSNLTSEVIPTAANNWKGTLYFTTKTTHGTDNLEVEFQNRGGNHRIWIHGAGAVADADGAADGMRARINAL